MCVLVNNELISGSHFRIEVIWLIWRGSNCALINYYVLMFFTSFIAPEGFLIDVKRIGGFFINLLGLHALFAFGTFFYSRMFLNMKTKFLFVFMASHRSTSETRLPLAVLIMNAFFFIKFNSFEVMTEDPSLFGLQ